MRTDTKTLVVMILFVLLFINIVPNGACRLLGDEFEEPWMKRGNLLLSSLQRGTVRPPGNGCCNTGGCGNPCIGSKKPSQQDHGCGYFKWKDEITFGNASFFPGPSTPAISSSRASSSSGLSGAALSPGNAECSNCKLLTMKIKILEARLAMERHLDDHACQSAAIIYELLNEMENLRVEAKEEDLKVARMISKLCVKLSAEIKEHRMFTQELDVSPGWVIIKGRTTEFLQELAERDEERVQQLQDLAREIEERAEEKMEFIEKLKGSTVAFMHATSPQKSLTLIIFLNTIDMS
ncbi:hypothetical protein Tco_0488547 [Tanacetum coccineum]